MTFSADDPEFHTGAIASLERRVARLERHFAPTPPAADDLAAARAEGWKAGRDAAVDWVMLYGERGMRLEDMREALLALVPSPPDAKPAPERERLKGWVNVYPKAGGGWRPGYCYDTRSEAARMAGGTDRTACIDLSQHYVGEGLEP